ncbi:G-protein coupled receptor GRL101-like isoform X1 [Lytechinus variegatus]|uniref:G-protein coupled receptor GRL101-like isoform X1 n=2 Tax=Lytechinus variegatus TaxID=7654 RepID=UPI001BB14C25|nr:G-protein coupled receptor GRL101-like isoform X1 [Lytechinus variegatus]
MQIARFSTMDSFLSRFVLALILLFSTINGQRNIVQVEDAECCSDIPVSSNMGALGSRCPTSLLETQCGQQGCCVAMNQTSERTVAETYRPYPCIGSDDVIEPWNVCDGRIDCPRADDEMYCGMHICALTIFDGISNEIEAPCPFSEDCYTPEGSCLSSELCPNRGHNATVITNLCVDPCPATCLCDALTMICFEYIGDGSEVEPIIHPRLLQFGLIDVREDVVMSNTSSTTNFGSILLFNPSDIPYVNTLAIISPDPLTELFHLEIEEDAFAHNSFLHTLVLKGTTLDSLTRGMFRGLSSLEYLNLDDNLIHNLTVDSFAHLTKLQSLTLANNQLTVIESGSFDGLRNLRSLNLDFNLITVIAEGAFYDLIQLRVLFLTTPEIQEFPVEIFEGLEGLQSMYVTDFRLCCRVSNLKECVDYEPVRFSSCSGLLEYQALGICMWLLGASAFFGNAFVLVMRLRAQRDLKRARKTVKIQSLLIINLATADLLTGLYMLVLAAADTAFGSEYFVYAAEWREGLPCKIIGILALLSGEASVLILALISIDRLLVVVFPFGPVHLSVRSVKIWAAVIWIFSTIAGILPPIITSVLSEDAVGYFYIYSDVCLGLPLIRSTDVDLVVEEYDYETGNVDYTLNYIADGKYAYYAILVFIGLNLLCFLIILFSYVAIFVYARRTARRAKRTPEREQELRLAARMALIVGTDFCCWMPIIILGILTQTGAVSVSTQMYAWCVVFIIPINSAVNPFLYTFGEACTRGRRGIRGHSSTPVASNSGSNSEQNSKGTKTSLI